MARGQSDTGMRSFGPVHSLSVTAARAQAQCVDRLSLGENEHPVSKRRTRQPRSPAPEAPSNRERRTSRRWIWLAGLTTLAVAVAALATVFLIRPVVRRTPDSNVLLITVDTLRADALGSYGNTRARTPVLDRLAANGVRFTTTRAHSVVTLPSHISLLTGLYPFSHGVRDNAGFRLPPNVDTLATVLKGARLSHRCVRERVPTRFAIRPGERVRRIRRSVQRRGRRVRVPGAGTARGGDDCARHRLAEVIAGAKLLLGARLRTALSLCGPENRSRPNSRTRHIWAR